MPAESEFNLLGVVHLQTLPGAPRPSLGIGVVRERALRDVEAMVEGGFRNIIVENFWDSPFPVDSSGPHVAACMASILTDIRNRFGNEINIGVNVLRNDARSALGIAASVEAGLIRVNVHVGATWTDQGLIQSEAHALLQYRRSLGFDGPSNGRLWTPGRVAIAADIMVKHGSPAGKSSLSEMAKDAVMRGGADVLIITGASTGFPAQLDDLDVVQDAVGPTPVWVGSGVQPENASEWRQRANGAIVGSYLHQEGDLMAPIDPDRVCRIVEIMR